MLLSDKFGRPITDLRISITDRCNYKCVYCRTGNEGALYGDLPFADYLRMARVLVGLGIKKIRITGGEPCCAEAWLTLSRVIKVAARGLKPESFGNLTAPFDFAQGRLLKPCPTQNRRQRAVLTTNRSISPHHQRASSGGHGAVAEGCWAERVTVSMDAVDPDRFARITRVPNGYDNVLAGIRASRRAGLWPVKVNCVLMRGFNEDQIIPFGMFAREEGVVVRFIEFMPLEEGRTWAPIPWSRWMRL